MPTIQEKAKEIREAIEHQKIEKGGEFSEQVKFRLELLTKEFEDGFSEVLPLLAETGVTYSANYKGKFEYMGAYIEFKYEGRRLKMDFNNKESYRYRYTSYIMRNTAKHDFGKYPLYAFILWIDEELVSKSK